MKIKFSFTKIYPKKALCVDFVSWMYPQHYSQEKKEKKRKPDTQVTTTSKMSRFI